MGGIGSGSKPREYPSEIVDVVVSLYNQGHTVKEVQDALPRGYKAQRIIERFIPSRRVAAKRDQRGKKNHMWKGENITYTAAHLRVQNAKGRAAEHPCIECGRVAKDWSYQGCAHESLTEKGMRFCAHPDHYEPRCRKCHRAFDRRHKEVMPNV